MTTTDHSERTATETTSDDPTTGRLKDRVRGLATTGNVVAAGTGLALGAVRLVLPWPLTKFLVGIAIVIAAVWVCKTLRVRFAQDQDATKADI